MTQQTILFDDTVRNNIAYGDICKSEQEIIDTARRHLASYQKPRSVSFVDSLPKAPTGKILKRELRKLYTGE